MKRVVVQASFGGPPPSWLARAQPPAGRSRSIQRRLPVGGRQAVKPGQQVFRAPAGLLDGAGRTGQPLPSPVLRKMERFFGADFSAVRVHVGREAASIGALAFTAGTDIFFAPGRYQPQAPAGQALLGHELTHVLQQRAGRVTSPLAAGAAVIHDDALEAEADRLGALAALRSHPPTGTQPKLVPEQPAMRSPRAITAQQMQRPAESRSSGRGIQRASSSQNAIVENIAAMTPVTLTLAHWDKERYNNEWVTAATDDTAFMAEIQKVAKAVGTQAQGKGLYLLTNPRQYSPKPGADNLMIVTCVNTPGIDVTNNPKPGSELYKAGLTNKDAVYKVQSGGDPPRMLMKYGGFYRLTTTSGVTMTTDLTQVAPATLDTWRRDLVGLSDRTGFNALKRQAQSAGIDVSTW